LAHIQIHLLAVQPFGGRNGTGTFSATSIIDAQRERNYR
jgi:hypothetical protein